MSVGLDVGSKAIKIVELEQSGSGFALRASGIVGYSGGSIEKMADEKELAPLADAIRKLYRDAKISSKEVSIALPETQVFTRSIKFPILSDAAIASAVRWEAEQYIPIPINEAIIQHQIIEKREDLTPAQTFVLLIAAPKKVVEKYVGLTSMAGLTCISVETGLIALARSLAPADQSVLIADFGARSTDIAVVKKGSLVVSRSIPTAGEAFTRALAQGLGIEPQQAEEYKRIYGLSQSQLEGKIKFVLDPIFRMVADEIKKAIHFFLSEEGGETPKYLILSGGTAGMPDAVGVMSKLLGMEVIIGNPFLKVAVDPESAKLLSGYAPLYSIAVGLALKK